MFETKSFSFNIKLPTSMIKYQNKLDALDEQINEYYNNKVYHYKLPNHGVNTKVSTNINTFAWEVIVTKTLTIYV